MASKEEEIKRLIEMMSRENNRENNDVALEAVEILRKRGWLKDGSLENFTIDRVDLRFVDLSGANLSKAKISYSRFAHADLSGANLSRAICDHVEFTSVDFIGATLNHTQMYYGVVFENANLTFANLEDADLSGSNLRGAMLWDVNLGQANLSKTILTRTNLSRGYLYKTNFESAHFDSTIMSDLDLSLAQGLESTTHIGPSTIGFDTIYKSHGKIPEVFLRGCGVSENLITYLPALMNTAIDFYSCFISYSHSDKSFARRVHDTLQGRGIRCWLDEKEMLPGDEIYKEIDRGIRYWDKVLLCCSKSSLSGWWVDHEIDKAFNKERELMKDRGEKVLALIPLDLDGYLFTDECADKNPKTQQIRSRIAGNFQGWEHDNALFEREIEKVIRALRTDGGKPPPPSPKL